MKFTFLVFFTIFILISETNGQEIPLQIKAKELTLVFPDWKLDRNYFEIQQKADSTFIYPELGETPEGTAFKFSEEIKIIKITQHYRTAAAISDEGPHWDLFDWKHYISPKIPLSKNGVYFILLKYSENQRSRFPDYSEKELTEHVNKHSPELLKLLYVNNVFNKTALYHSISEIYLTITYSRPGSAEVLTQVVVFNLPLGC